jgi:hypothetical protein
VPSACFTISPSTITANQNVTFSNCTKNGLVYYWNFGDGNGDSVDASPGHTYLVPGYYNVVLVALNKYGDSGTVSHTIFVNPISSNIYSGTFTGNESCSSSGIGSLAVTITGVSDSILNIYNLYNSGQTFIGHANGFTINVPPQTYNSVSGNKLMQATIQMLGDTATESFNGISISLIVTGFSSRDACQGTLVK